MKVMKTHIRTGRSEIVDVPVTPYGPVYESPEQYMAMMNAVQPKLWHFEPVKKEVVQ